MRRFAAVILTLALTLLPSMSKGMPGCCGALPHECAKSSHASSHCASKSSEMHIAVRAEAPVAIAQARCSCCAGQVIPPSVALRHLAKSELPNDGVAGRQLTLPDLSRSGTVRVQQHGHTPGGTSSLFMINCSFIS